MLRDGHWVNTKVLRVVLEQEQVNDKIQVSVRILPFNNYRYMVKQLLFTCKDIKEYKLDSLQSLLSSFSEDRKESLDEAKKLIQICKLYFKEYLTN